jgi:predicted nucleic acid-binding protein
MQTGIGIRARERAANAVSRVTVSKSRRPSALDYALRLKTVANDTVLRVRDSAQSSQSDWKRAHDDLVRLAKQRAGLDWEEGRSLLCALRSQAHRRLGYGSFVEYIERLFGYSPRFTMEKVRVAEALEVLTEMAQALKDGEVCWSALREVTRVATRRTEGDWLRAARGRTVRQIEQMVSGRKPGDGPNDPADEAHRRHVIRLEVSGATYATFREMMAKIRRDAGEPLDDDAAVMMMARQVLGGPKDPGRSNYQVKLDVCESCRRGWQEGRGQTVEVPPEVVEMAECDGQQIPSRADAHVGGAAEEPSAKPVRATQSIPPSVRREVLRRDRGCCVVPGCTHGSFLDVHHIKPREEGGGHDAAQLATLCGAHHAAVHQGRIVIEGHASERLAFFHADGTSYGGTVSPEIVDLKTKAFQALRHMGFKETEARWALDAVKTHVGAMTLESILKHALLALT